MKSGAEMSIVSTGSTATRRSVLGLVASLAGVGMMLVSGRAPAAESGDRELMERAFEMKRRAVGSGDQPYGAIVVKDGQVVGEGPSRVVTNGDPTAHAEMEAIRDAARRLDTRNLAGCVIYASSRPCPMCETAAYWANVSRIYYGQHAGDGGSPRYPSC
jgi:guanine deaminase